jgi:hypothetical protein
VQGIIQVVVQAIGPNLKADLDIANKYGRVLGVQPRIDDLPREAWARRLLEIRHERCAVLGQLLPDRCDTLGVPPHGCIRAAQCLHVSAREAGEAGKISR